MLVLGKLENDDEVIQALCNYNKAKVICIYYIFNSLCLLDLSTTEDCAYHQEVKHIFTDKGAGFRYFFNGEEL